MTTKPKFPKAMIPSSWSPQGKEGTGSLSHPNGTATPMGQPSQGPATPGGRQRFMPSPVPVPCTLWSVRSHKALKA